MPVLRISLLTEIPAPFRIPLFNALAAEPNVALDVLFLSARDPKRPYPLYDAEHRFEWRILPGHELVRRGRWIVFNRGVVRALRRFKPSMIVIGGWNQPAFWGAALYARTTRTPLVAWVESTSRDLRPGTPLTELPKRTLLRACAAFLVPGRASAEYLHALGVDFASIVLAPNAVDQAIFGAAVAAARETRDGLRDDLGLRRCTFLFVGRLDHEKGLDTLLTAAASVEADFAVVGEGADRARLHDLAPANVRFVGRLARDELVSWYAAADAFVLPSRSDQWGMVLNEAAAAGLPLVSTDAPGAAHDLIEDGVNGFRVPVDNPAALARALRQLAEDPAFRELARQRSLEISERFTPAAWADAVISSARKLAARSAR